MIDSYEYDAFGNEFTVSDSTPNNYLYRGEQYDPDLGLYYLRARYYNPNTGRFMSRDPNAPQPRNSKAVPIDPKYLHKYLYANGDPINRIDPGGRIDLFEASAQFVEDLGDEIGEAIYEHAEEALWCKAFDIFEEQLADAKFPWWYCEVGSL